ncbi:MAG: RNA polymerase sigma factor [candidate division Zixibacteria bacterium]|nr:RNA polymerase sigma factor [candidate division Zixibacteria bacterium]
MAMNRDLFWQLIEKEHQRARDYCGKLMGDFMAGDDLYQDAVIRAYRGCGGLREDSAFKSWFYTIIGNTYKSRFRSAWWRRIVRRDESSNIAELLQHNPSGAYEARRRLEYAMEALSANDRMIVTLAELEGWKISEIAEMFSAKEGAIKMRLSRARTKMRERLGRIYKNNYESFKNRG